MNNLQSISKSVEIFEKKGIGYALLHTTSVYPTAYENIRLGALDDLKTHFPNSVIGLSDHSLGNYACFAAVSLGAAILEKHFTSDKCWSGPDIPVSIDPAELTDLIHGSNAIFQAKGGTKNIIPEEQPTINFAYASVVALKDIQKGDLLTTDNIWVKRPGTGAIKAERYNEILNHKATVTINKDSQLDWNMIGNE